MAQEQFKKLVLLVEDEPELLEALSDLLSEKYRILTASNGLEGLAIALTQNPDCVISDINMPKMNGLDMLERIHEKEPQIPVIIVTGYGDTEKTRRAWNAGAFDFLDKPFDEEELFSVIRNAIDFGNGFRIMKKPIVA